MGINRKSELTLDHLKEILSYDPETGGWTRLIQTSNRVKVGKVKEYYNNYGYTRISIGNRHYLLHCLAWFYMMGVWPENDIDHINGVKDDNRWCNLRAATRSQNLANKGRSKRNTSGLKGVYFAKHANKWCAMIKINGKNKNLGYFDCPAAAHFAYLIAADKLFGEFARAR